MVNEQKDDVGIETKQKNDSSIVAKNAKTIAASPSIIQHPLWNRGNTRIKLSNDEKDRNLSSDSTTPTPLALPAPSYKYYGQCLLGGITASSIRWILTPIDSVKCNMQVHPKLFPNFVIGLSKLYHDGMLYRGLIPTIFSYSTQTGTKYMIYEYLKDHQYNYHHQQQQDSYQKQHQQAAGGAGEKLYLWSQQLISSRTWIYISSATCAEAIAVIFMCPWEVLKVRMQTATTSAASATTGGSHHHHHHQQRGGGVVLGGAMANNNNISGATGNILSTSSRMMSELLMMKNTNTPGTGNSSVGTTRIGSIIRSLWAPLIPLWSRQILGTVANFVTFEYTTDLCNKYYDQYYHSNNSNNRGSIGNGPNDITNIEEIAPSPPRFVITLFSGFISGIVSAIISHPADSLLSLQTTSRMSSMTSGSKGNQIMSLYEIYQQVGFVRLATKGLYPRMIMTGSIISIQWLIYDTFKQALGYGSTLGGSR